MRVQRDGRDFKVEVTADGEGLVSHAGAALLAGTADRVGPWTRALSCAFSAMPFAGSAGSDRGRVIRDHPRGDARRWRCTRLADLRTVRDQQPLFGVVASDTTAFRVIAQIAGDPALLEGLRAAHAEGRARAWELGVKPSELVIDVDATLIVAHSEKDGAAGTFKGGFGFHSLLAFLDGSREALAGLLRPGERRPEHCCRPHHRPR